MLLTEPLVEVVIKLNSAFYNVDDRLKNKQPQFIARHGLEQFNRPMG